MSGRHDLLVVGAGILGLATALAATRRGWSVAVVDRDTQANGASIRNFGFVTVSGQERGQMWARARRTRDTWLEVGPAAGITVIQSGAWITARRPESVAVLESFLETEMAEGCRLLGAAEARRRCPALVAPELQAVLVSDAEFRVESREAIPRLASWLERTHGVTFIRDCTALAVELPEIRTSRGPVQAARLVVCPGDDFSGLYGDRLARYSLTRCKLQMMRLADPGFRLPGTVLSDLSIARYSGFSDLAPAAALKARLASEHPEELRRGVHLIVAQGADGSLVVGDSHEYATTPDPFSHQGIDDLILREFESALGIPAPRVFERWTGTYASAADRAVLVDAPEPQVRILIVTSGAGASTGFALGEEVISSFGED